MNHNNIHGVGGHRRHSAGVVQQQQSRQLSPNNNNRHQKNKKKKNDLYIDWGFRSLYLVMIVISMMMILTIVDDEETGRHDRYSPNNAYHPAAGSSSALNTRQQPSLVTELVRNPQQRNQYQHQQQAGRTVASVNSTAFAAKTTSAGTTTATAREQRATIAYAVTITSCATTNPHDKDKPFPIADTAAVLKYSIHRQHQNNKYGYQMVAVYHPIAASCARSLEQLDYRMIERETPINVTEIRGTFLRNKIETNGCCGERELLKLEAWTLTEYPIVVLLDLDVLVMQPLDAIFDLMIQMPPSQQRQEVSLSDTTTIVTALTAQRSTKQQQQEERHLLEEHLEWPDRYYDFLTSHNNANNNPHHEQQESAPNIQFAYTIDYQMVSPRRKVKPIQGGFLILRPNVTVYQDIRSIVLEGDYRDRSSNKTVLGNGWGGETGKFWGSMTIQGLLPYYFIILHPEMSLELNHCRYNNMGQQPRQMLPRDPHNKHPYGICSTNDPQRPAEQCEDCRLRHIATEVVSVHYTSCGKPWKCLPHQSRRSQELTTLLFPSPADLTAATTVNAATAINKTEISFTYPDETIRHHVCRQMHHEWFRTRLMMEQHWLGKRQPSQSQQHTEKTVVANSSYYPEMFYGYCHKAGVAGYQYIEQPYGQY